MRDPATQVNPKASGFFDWASLSPLCAAASKAQRGYVDAATNLVDAPYAMRQATDLTELRSAVRDLVNGEARHSIVLGRSASEFLSMLALGLNGGARDHVILCEPNHDCVPLAWLGTAAFTGHRVRVLPALPTRQIDLEALERTLDEQCSVVVLTHVDHLHGVVQPVEEVVRLAHAVGARVIIDGAQAVGRISVDVSALDADVYIGVGRKALLASIGTAFLVADQALVEDVRPLIWSTRAARLNGERSPQLVPSPTHLEGNLPDLGALAGLSAAVTAFDHSTVAELESRVAIQLPRLVEGLVDAGLRPFVPVRAGNAGITSFHLPAHANGLQLQRNLRQEGLVIAASSGDCRVSLHLANEDDDLERLTEEMRRNV